MEDGRIADSQITASSERGSNHAAQYARLNYMLPSGIPGGWSARWNNLNQWIQVDLPTRAYVTGIITQGREFRNSQFWVTRFKVRYSNNGVHWIPVLADNQMDVSFD